jgi:hypothetical protein
MPAQDDGRAGLGRQVFRQTAIQLFLHGNGIIIGRIGGMAPPRHQHRSLRGLSRWTSRGVTSSMDLPSPSRQRCRRACRWRRLIGAITHRR